MLEGQDAAKLLLDIHERQRRDVELTRPQECVASAMQAALSIVRAYASRR